MMYDLSKWLQLYLFKVKPKKIIVLKHNYGQAPSLGVTNYRHPDITIKKKWNSKKKTNEWIKLAHFTICLAPLWLYTVSHLYPLIAPESLNSRGIISLVFLWLLLFLTARLTSTSILNNNELTEPRFLFTKCRVTTKHFCFKWERLLYIFSLRLD